MVLYQRLAERGSKYQHTRTGCGMILPNRSSTIPIPISQRAVVAADMIPMLAGEAKKRQAHGLTAPGKTLVTTPPQALAGKSRDVAAKAVGVGSTTVERALRPF